jgi:hypothetical protein
MTVLRLEFRRKSNAGNRNQTRNALFERAGYSLEAAGDLLGQPFQNTHIVVAIR